MTKPDPTVTETPPWAPDSRWAIPAVAAVWVWTLGWLPVWAARWGDPITPWLMFGFGVVAGVAGVWRARSAWPTKTYGDALREQGSLLAVVAGLAIGGWLVQAGFTDPWRATPLLLVGAGILGLWYATLVSVAPRHHAEEKARREHVELQTDQEMDRELLDESGCSDVLVIGHENTRAGYTVTLGPDPAYPKRPKYVDMLNRLGDLTTNLGIYWRSRDGTVLGTRDVVLEEQASDRWLLHVSTKHVLRETVPYHPNPQPRSFNDPVMLGLYENGDPMEVSLLGKGMKVIGATGGGKSVIENNIIARALECRDERGRPDAMVWLCGVEKVVPLVYPWLLPWLEGRTTRPVIDWIVGEDPGDVRQFLLTVYYLIKSRNDRNRRRSKAGASADQPGIVVIVEEARAAAALTEQVQMENGEWWTISRLLAESMTLTRSAGVGFVLVTQEGLYEGLGPYGANLMRSLTVRACTVTMTESDGRMSLPKLPGSVDTTKLTDYSMYLQRGITEDSRAMPGKAAHLDEDKVPPVAEALSAQLAQLSAADVEAIGADYYAARWNRETIPLLVEAAENDPEAPGGGFAWPVAALPPTPDETELPVYTPDDVGSGIDDRDPEPSGDWDAAMRVLLGEPPAPPKAETRGTGPFGLPGQEDIEHLEELARRMQREAAEQLALPHASPVSLPQPLGMVIDYLDSLTEVPEWIPSFELARGAFGSDVPNGGHRLGLALAKIEGADLHSTDPKPVPGGGKARGFLTAELYRAAAALRDGAAGS